MRAVSPTKTAKMATGRRVLVITMCPFLLSFADATMYRRYIRTELKTTNSFHGPLLQRQQKRAQAACLLSSVLWWLRFGALSPS